MIGPPTNSASVNCQPIRIHKITPSSTTRLVEANSNAIAAMKSAPFRNRERAKAMATYEQEEDAAPSPLAIRIVRALLSGSSRLISPLVTTACTKPDSTKPMTSGQRICQAMAKAIANAA